MEENNETYIKEDVLSILSVELENIETKINDGTWENYEFEDEALNTYQRNVFFQTIIISMKNIIRTAGIESRQKTYDHLANITKTVDLFKTLSNKIRENYIFWDISIPNFETELFNAPKIVENHIKKLKDLEENIYKIFPVFEAYGKLSTELKIIPVEK